MKPPPLQKGQNILLSRKYTANFKKTSDYSPNHNLFEMTMNHLAAYEAP